MSTNFKDKTAAACAARDPDFSQVVVWPGTTGAMEDADAFKAFMLEELQARVQPLEEITTNPDLDAFNRPIPDTGGRTDLFFAVHKEDITSRFCTLRLRMGMRWIEDALAPHNHSAHLYPARVKEYCSWDAAETPETLAAVRAAHSCD